MSTRQPKEKRNKDSSRGDLTLSQTEDVMRTEPTMNEQKEAMMNYLDTPYS